MIAEQLRAGMGRDFCIWDGGFLPSEAEWSYAATAGTEQRMYPWGSGMPTLDHASYSVDTIQQCMGDDVPGCSLEDLIRVGTKPLGDGKYGQSDLGGNVMETRVTASTRRPRTS